MTSSTTPEAVPNSVCLDNIFLREFPAGYHFNTHLHRSAELLVCRKGRVSISIHGVAHVVEPGDYFVVFPNIPHSTDVPDESACSVLQLHFHSDTFPELAMQHAHIRTLPFLQESCLGKRRFLSGASSPQLTACLDGLLAEAEARPEYSEHMISLYLSQLLLLLSRDLKSLTGNSPLYENRHLIDATLYINQHFPEKLKVSDVAAAAGISTRYLTRLFHEYLNLSVSAYITYVRISKAIDYKYASPQYPLINLAFDVGFSSQQHFSKIFKETMGVSPQKYFSILTSACQ